MKFLCSQTVGTALSCCICPEDSGAVNVIRMSWCANVDSDVCRIFLLNAYLSLYLLKEKVISPWIKQFCSGARKIFEARRTAVFVHLITETWARHVPPAAGITSHLLWNVLRAGHLSTAEEISSSSWYPSTSGSPAFLRPAAEWSPLYFWIFIHLLCRRLNTFRTKMFSNLNEAVFTWHIISFPFCFI